MLSSNLGNGLENLELFAQVLLVVRLLPEARANWRQWPGVVHMVEQGVENLSSMGRAAGVRMEARVRRAIDHALQWVFPPGVVPRGNHDPLLQRLAKEAVRRHI